MAKIRGGDKIERALAVMTRNVTNPAALRVGFLDKAKYPDGTPVAMIAAVHNYGAPRAGIPPRPFFSNMIHDRKDEWPGQFASSLSAVNYDATKALQMMGHVIAGQLKKSIIDTNDPPLAPATIARKGFSKPLIDTSHMINSVDFEVG